MKKLLIILTLLNFALLFAATGEYDGTSKYGTATMDVSANVQTLANNNARVYFGFTTSSETGNTISHMTDSLVLSKSYQSTTAGNRTFIATGTVYCFFRIAYKQSLKFTLKWNKLGGNSGVPLYIYKDNSGTSLSSSGAEIYRYNPSNADGLVVDDRVELKLSTGNSALSEKTYKNQMTTTLTLTVATV